MEQILLHTCCGPDLTYAYEYFSKKFRVCAYFANDNIDSAEEHERRWLQAERVAGHYSFEACKKEYEPSLFEAASKGLEEEREQGKRCEACHRMNFESTAKRAEELNIKNISTTLTISPHKNVEMINRIGREVAEGRGLHFEEENLRKGSGFKRSIEVSRALNLYRQNWCGCKFSRGKLE